MSEVEIAIEKARGGLEVLDSLVEEFAQWLEEANEEGQEEALENVLGHVESMRREYAVRLEEAEARAAASRG
ncbi:MAG: hypothetical protein WDN04_23470 [Rhodospirillales bacterium]